GCKVTSRLAADQRCRGGICTSGNPDLECFPEPGFGDYRIRRANARPAGTARTPTERYCKAEPECKDCRHRTFPDLSLAARKNPHIIGQRSILERKTVH